MSMPALPAAHRLSASSTALLPPCSGRLLPAADANLRGTGQDPEAAAFLARMSVLTARGADHARVLATRAAGAAEARRPAVEKRARAMAAATGVQASRLAARAAVLAAESLAGAEAISHEANRGRLAGKHRKNLMVGCAALLALIVAASVYVKQAAATAARIRVEAALNAYGMRSTVHYRSVSASLFGGVTLQDVSIATQEGWILRADALRITHIDADGGVVRSLGLAVDGLILPILQVARAEPLPWATQLAGLGYLAPRMDLTLDVRFDDADQLGTIRSAGTISALGSWDFSASIGGITAQDAFAAGSAIVTLSNGPNAGYGQAFGFGAQADPARAVQTIQGIAAGITLRDVSISLANRGLLRRQRMIPSADTPPEDLQTPPHTLPDDVASNLKTAMSPSEADAAVAVLEAWLDTGGSIMAQARPAAPLPLFRSNTGFGAPTPTLGDPDFLAALNLKISG